MKGNTISYGISICFSTLFAKIQHFTTYKLTNPEYQLSFNIIDIQSPIYLSLLTYATGMYTDQLF